MPAYFFWYQLHPGEPVPQDLERLKKISAKVTITYCKDGGGYGQTSVTTKSFEGDQLYSLRARDEHVHREPPHSAGARRWLRSKRDCCPGP